MFFYGSEVNVRFRAFWVPTDDYNDYCKFIEPYRGRKDLFVRDRYKHGLKFWVWRFRQKYLGRP